MDGDRSSGLGEELIDEIVSAARHAARIQRSTGSFGATEKSAAS
jgi:hypothetical protein